MDSFRADKAEAMRRQGIVPYASSFDRTCMLAGARELPDGSRASVAGRVVLLREMGKMTFMTLQDHTGRMQVAFKEDVMGAEAYKAVHAYVDLGDFIGVRGDRFMTQKGEPTIMASEWTMLSKSLRQPPEKWHGIADQETAWRQRYLDLTSNRETFDRFVFRSEFIRQMRAFYWQNDFVEMETPVLVNAASGALATPFVTHHEAYDMDVFLRIATETYLKECLVGGFDRVFEVGRIFRNEGLDPSHLQDFTMVEHYAAYWDYVRNMQFTEDMLSAILKEMTGSTLVKIPDRDGALIDVDFAPPWPRISIRDLIRTHCGIDINDHETAEALRTAIRSKNVRLEVPVETLGRGNLIDQLYKKVARPNIIQPTFVVEHPIDLSPLARRNDGNPSITDRFQLVVGTWEIVNAYSELVDPVDQAQRFDDQAKANAGGDSDAHRKDDDYVKALEHGCPPCSGWGMGVDRIVALLTRQTNLRDVVLFPLMKPDEKNQGNQKREKNQKSCSVTASGELPNEASMRFVAVLNKKIESGKLMNALGHMTAGLSDLAGQSGNLCFLEYQDKDGGSHPNISHFPFIVLKAENGNQIRSVRQKAMEMGISFTDFTSTMTIGGSEAQRAATREAPEAELEYYGICLFGDTETLKAITKKFSLFA